MKLSVILLSLQRFNAKAAKKAQTLGFKKLILPVSNKKGLEKLLGMRVVGVRNLEEAMDELF